MPDQTIQCTTACTVTVVHEISLPVLNLGLEEGAQISGAILLIWGIGWTFRVLIQTLKNTDGNSTNESE